MNDTRVGKSQHVAAVERKGVVMRRLSLALPDETQAEFRTTLADKARRWITESPNIWRILMRGPSAARRSGQRRPTAESFTKTSTMAYEPAAPRRGAVLGRW